MGEIKIQFKKASDYRLIPVTGAWGGVNPQREIIFDLFVERSEIQAVRMKAEHGQPSMETGREEETLVRESMVGIVVRPDIARSIGEWLVQKAIEASGTAINLGEEGQA